MQRRELAEGDGRRRGREAVLVLALEVEVDDEQCQRPADGVEVHTAVGSTLASGAAYPLVP